MKRFPEPDPVVLLVWPADGPAVLFAQVGAGGVFASGVTEGGPGPVEEAALEVLFRWRLSSKPPHGWRFSEWSLVEPEDVPASALH